jgi:hypothetical protein
LTVDVKITEQTYIHCGKWHIKVVDDDNKIAFWYTVSNPPYRADMTLDKADIETLESLLMAFHQQTEKE